MKVICPYCKDEGKTSTIQCGMTSSTLLGIRPWHDEFGNAHFHDSNSHTTDYFCSNEHHFSISRYKKCSCGWQYKTDSVNRFTQGG